MKNIYQLAKLSRRIPNQIRRWSQRHGKAKTPAQATNCLVQVQICESRRDALMNEIERRNINRPAKRAV